MMSKRQKPYTKWSDRKHIKRDRPPAVANPSESSPRMGGYFKWTPEARGRLGRLAVFMGDAFIAHELGISKAAVRRARHKFGIKSYANPQCVAQYASLAERIRNLVGETTNDGIAARLEISVETVKYIRAKYGIRSYAMRRFSRPVPPQCLEAAPLGDSDRVARMVELAARIGSRSKNLLTA